MSDADVVITIRVRLELEPLILSNGVEPQPEPIPATLTAPELATMAAAFEAARALPPGPVPEPGGFACPECGRTFDSAQGVVMHTMRAHQRRGGRATVGGMTRAVQCPVCGAQPGQRCRNLRDGGLLLKGHHPDRTKLARELKANAT